jgi:tetratricopeptide (TPR) repeat protein
MRLFTLFLAAASGIVGADCTPSRLDAAQTLAKFQELDRAAQSAFDGGRFVESARLYRQAACLVPNSARALFGLGGSEAAASNFPAARNAFEKAAALLPENSMPLAMLVRVDVAMHDLPKLKETLRAAAAHFPRDADLHSGLARFLAENQLLDLALAESLRAEQTGAIDNASAVALAVLENTVGAYHDAIGHAMAIERQTGLDAQVKASAAGVAGLSYASLGQKDEAERYLKMAIELAPAQDNSYLALAYFYEKGQRFNDAAGVLKQGRERSSDPDNFVLPLGNNLVWGEQFQAGVDVLRELIAKRPEIAEAYIRLAEAYRKMGRPELETETLGRLARLKPNYPMIHILAAQAMMTMDPVDYPKVLVELAAAEKIAPNDADVFYLRGKALAATNRLREAVIALKRATELRPIEPNAYYQLGLTYQKMGETELAHQTMERLRYIRQIAATPSVR